MIERIYLPISGSVTATTYQSQHGTESNDNEDVIHSQKASRLEPHHQMQFSVIRRTSVSEKDENRFMQISAGEFRDGHILRGYWYHVVENVTLSNMKPLTFKCPVPHSSCYFFPVCNRSFSFQGLI